MENVLAFVFENHNIIASWRVVDETMDGTIVEFTMLDGERVQMIG